MSYYEKNKQFILEKQKKYREENRSEYLQKRKIYYQHNKKYINQYFKNWKRDKLLKIINEKRNKLKNEMQIIV